MRRMPDNPAKLPFLKRRNARQYATLAPPAGQRRAIATRPACQTDEWRSVVEERPFYLAKAELFVEGTQADWCIHSYNGSWPALRRRP
ncbi:hypothetical protein R69776_04030 [Paraburkholderia nemoris]|uniref:Uncharacterized protein n=1 Tax=Paraburkholderia nemoris TaxID=2793076 RepID=A0ABM8RW49_9BURK|nr:hypothetical protein R69776_04030 [Paraburkholderia nemoris]